MSKPTITKEDVFEREGVQTYTEVATEPDRVTRTLVIRGVPEVTITNCYCCSCDDTGDGLISSDAACRNHGFAATRPCEVHHMPGQPWGDELGEDHPDYGRMPETVQQKIRADQKRYDDWKALHG